MAFQNTGGAGAIGPPLCDAAAGQDRKGGIGGLPSPSGWEHPLSGEKRSEW